MLLASGAAIPISQLKPGDKVLATNTKTGRTQAKSVRAVILEYDNDLYDLTVKVHGRTAVIQTTQHHRFWDQTTRRWTFADALSTGDFLRIASRGKAAFVSGYAPSSTTGWMWDLTVASDHDFYVDVATTAVLVHNCPAPRKGGGANDAPSWVAREAGLPQPGETAQQYATRILNEKYGVGNWRTGGGSEFSQIVKWVTRGGRLS